MLHRLLIIVAVAMLSIGQGVFAQEKGVSRKAQEKHLAKKEKKDAKAKKKQDKADKKRHLSLQDKATRKRMKRNTKRADRSGPGRHREPFLKRLFTK